MLKMFNFGYYRVPMVYAPWRLGELRTVLEAAGSLGETTDPRKTLAAELGSLYSGSVVTLWNSGRSALEAGLIQIAASAGGKNEVLTPSLVCRSVPERILSAGLRPVFYDSKDDFSPDLSTALNCLSGKTAALVVPYVYGGLVSLGEASKACLSLGIPLVEDCAASFLLRNEEGVLSGSSGDFSIFSFSTGKTLVAGGGGALIQRDHSPSVRQTGWTKAEERCLARQKVRFALEYAWPGIGYAMQKLTGWRYASLHSRTISSPRTISDVDAALTLLQWERWPSLYAGRLHVIERYARNLAGLRGIRLPQYQPARFVSRLFVEFLGGEESTNKMGAEFLRSRSIGVHLPYSPTHRSKELGWLPDSNLPVASRLADHTLAIPCHPGLSNAEIDRVSDALHELTRHLEHR